MADTDIIVSEMTPASQINTGDLMIMTQPDAQAETGYTTKSGTVLQMANKQLKGIDFPTDLPSFDNPNVLGGLEELKADIKALLPIGSASGNPCNFTTDLADALVSLTAEIVASGGGGTPSSPIPIVGHSELNLTRCGKNLFSYDDLPLYAGYFDGTNFNGTPLDEVDIETVESWQWVYYLIPVSGNSNITLSGFDSLSGVQAVWLFDLNDFSNFQNAFGSNEKNGTHAIPNNAKYLVVPMPDVLSQRTNYANAQAEFGTIASEYAPYNGQTFTVAFGQTVYGGVYDKSGRLTINYQVLDENAFTSISSGTTTGGLYYVEVNGTDSKLDGNGLCNMLPQNNLGAWTSTTPCFQIAPGTEGRIRVYCTESTLSDFKTAYSGLQIAYELATPIVIDVQAISPSAVVGTNNIISDCNGDVNVQYRDSIQHYIDSKIASVQALIL